MRNHAVAAILLSLIASGCHAPGNCTDQTKNGDETDVDCGGSCAPCGLRAGCLVDVDCKSHFCGRSGCAFSRCYDEIQNDDETDVDCGGSCVSKADNQSGRCAAGHACRLDTDCAYLQLCAFGSAGLQLACRGGVCTHHCKDGVRNGTETDLDCGGATTFSSCTNGFCDPCSENRRCELNWDCKSFHCDGGLCGSSRCNDGIRNNDESDVDCGGHLCPRCGSGQECNFNTDCNTKCDRGFCL